MGLLARISGDLVEYVEWQNKEQNSLVYKFEKYRHHIKTGGKILVNEDEAAVFASMGKTADILGPGECSMNSSVLPELALIQDWKKTNPESFIADIFFINTKETGKLPWNTVRPLILNCCGRKIEARLRGKFSIKAADLKVFAGLLIKKADSDITDIFTGYIFSAFQGREYASLAEIREKGTDITDEELEKMKNRFSTAGIELCGITIENISFPDSELADDHFHIQTSGINQSDSDGPGFSESLYYTIENGNQTGPFNIGQLIDRFIKNEISKTTYVWTSGMEQWQTAGTVRELQAVFRKIL